MPGPRWLAIPALTVFLLLMETATPEPAGGQEGPFAFHLRGGVTQPVAEFGQSDKGWEGEADRGPSLSMGFTFPFFGPLGLYAGFSQYRFRCDPLVCPKGQAWVSTGFDLAARIVVGQGPLRAWIQGGLHTHRMEARLKSEGPPETLKSEGGGGYEVGGGVLIKVGERTSLAPGVRYGLGNVPVDGKPTLGPRFLVFDIGLVLGF